MILHIAAQDMPGMQAYIESLNDAQLTTFYLSAAYTAFSDPGELEEDDPESEFYDSTTETWFLVLDMIQQEFEKRRGASTVD